LRIQLIRSATLRISFGKKIFLIDPWFAEKGYGPSYAGRVASPLVNLPMPVGEILEGVDAVIVSHLHTDHFDEVARGALDRDIPIFCHARFAEPINAFGFSNVKSLSGTVSFGDVRLSVTDGRHGPDEILGEMGPVSGFVFRAKGEPTLYWAGDTILCDEVRDVITTECPDVIVVHGCGAVWNGIGPLVMDRSMVFETLRISGSAAIIACHLDAVDHATVSRKLLRKASLKEPEITKRLSIPEDGEVLNFGS